MNESKLRQIIREEVRNELSENSKVVNDIETARKKIEEEVVPVLDRMYGVMKAVDRDKAGWVRSIREDQKDVYEELSDLESSLKADNTQLPGF